jgi:hypothetical protein
MWEFCGLPLLRVLALIVSGQSTILGTIFVLPALPVLL